LYRAARHAQPLTSFRGRRLARSVTMVVVEGLPLGSARGRWVVLAATLASAIAFLDGTVVNVALRHIALDLDATLAQLEWVINAYMLALASLILVGGSLGDRLGRRDPERVD